MKLVYKIVLFVLVLLAISSGITKIALMQQEVAFFGRYGFTDPLLMAFGAAQLIGGLLLPFRKTRFAGAAIVAVTFLVSLALLLMDGNIPVGAITAVATLLLGVVMKNSWNAVAPSSEPADT